MLLHYLGKQIKRSMWWNKQKNWKNIPDGVDRNLKEDQQIVVFLAEIFLKQLAIK